MCSAGVRSDAPLFSVVEPLHSLLCALASLRRLPSRFHIHSFDHQSNNLNDQYFLDKLRPLIGRDCDYLGRHCRLIEILPDQDLLVLEHRETTPPIQTDQYGQASFRGNDIVQIPIHDRDGDSFSEEMMDLFSCLSRLR